MSRAHRACAALLVVWGLVSCHEGPTDPLTRVQTLQPVDSALQVKAGTEALVKVLVLDASGNPVAGVSVNWEASSGYLARTTTPSDANGVAVNKWTALGELGAVQITASVGALQPLKFPVEVVPGFATKLDILADSVNFTAQAQTRVVRVVGFDEYGHQISLGTAVLQRNASYASAVATTPVGDTAVMVLTSGYGAHRGTLVLTTSDGRARDSVLVVLNPVLAGIQQISGLDSATGLVVGERTQLQVTGIDSLGHAIANVDVTTAGLQLSTSDANVATTASDGSVTAVAPGRVTIDAMAGGVAYRVPVTVYPMFDVGTQTAGVELLNPNAYSQTPLGQYLTDAGRFYDLSSYVGAGAPPHPVFAVLQAHAANGAAAWTRSYPTSYVEVVVDPASGVAYLADHLRVIHAIDATGNDRWSFDYSAISTGGCWLAGWKDGVAAACGTHVFALDGNGSLAWSATVADTVRQVISTPALTVVRMNGSVAAIADDGSIAWTKTSSPTDMIADASSTVYLLENGVRAIDVSGVERWHSPGALGDCILATAERLVVCRNISVITALDPGDGHVRWTATSPTSFGSMAAISGDRILVSGAYMFALDARTGAVLGRSLNRLDEYYVAVGNGAMAVTSTSFGRVFSTSFAPGSEWAQRSGNAGHGRRVTP